MTRNALRLHLSRLLATPEVRVIERGDGRSLVAVDGLVCGACAGRASRALAGVEGVRGVEVDLDRGVAYLEHDGELPRPLAMQSALDRVVVALPLRRLLARLVRRRNARAAG